MPKHIFKIAMDPASKDIAGSVKLSDEINSNLNVDNSTASTPYATKQAYDKALESVDAVSKVNEKVEALTPLVNTNTESITIINTQITDINSAVDGLGTAAYTDKTAYVPSYHASSVGKSIVPIGGQDNGFGHVNLTDIYTENDFDQTKGYAATPEALYKVYQITQEKFDKTGGTIDGNLIVTGDVTVEGTINASISGTSENAVRSEYATKDATGNVITETYATKEELANIDVTSKLHKVATSGDYEDLINKPILYTQEEVDNLLNNKTNISDILDDNSLIKSSLLPSYVDDVIEVDSYDVLITTAGESSKIYITLDDNKSYRWSGTTYVEIASSLVLGTISGTAYEGSAGKQLENDISDIQTDITNITTNYSTKKELENLNVSIATIAGDITELQEKVTSLSKIGIVHVNTAGGVFPIDDYKIAIMTLTSDSTFTFSRSEKLYHEFYLYVTNGGNYNVEFSDNVKWHHGFTPILSENATDIIKFTTIDFGKTWFGIPVCGDL